MLVDAVIKHLGGLDGDEIAHARGGPAESADVGARIELAHDPLDDAGAHLDAAQRWEGTVEGEGMRPSGGEVAGGGVVADDVEHPCQFVPRGERVVLVPSQSLTNASWSSVCKMVAHRAGPGGVGAVAVQRLAQPMGQVPPDLPSSRYVELHMAGAMETVVKEGALAALAASKPGVKSRERDYELEAVKAGASPGLAQG